MLRRLQLSYVNNKNVIRIVSYSLLSVLFLIVTWFFDFGFPQAKEHLPQILLLSKEVSTSFLSNLSGVFLTVTTFTFTTILTILNHYSSSFTPRIIQDFIEKPNVHSLFGIFIGGFFYTVLALFFLTNLASETMVVSGTIAVFYAIASMIAFILFVHRVFKDIKVDNVIDTIYHQAFTLVQEEAEARRQSERYDQDRFIEKLQIYGQSTGYLYAIDQEALASALDGIACELVITKKIGQYIPKGMYIATLHFLKEHGLTKDQQLELVKSVSKGLVINTAKNDQQDYHLEMTNLIEIALRALSPGINDPNTAIICIDKLSLLLGKLFSSQNHFIVMTSNEQMKVVYQAYSVEEELYLTFNQILHYAKDEPTVARSILENIYLIYMISDETAQEQVKGFFDYSYDTCYAVLSSELDKSKLEAIRDDFLTNRDQQSDQKTLRETEE